MRMDEDERENDNAQARDGERVCDRRLVYAFNRFTRNPMNFRFPTADRLSELYRNQNVIKARQVVVRNPMTSHVDRLEQQLLVFWYIRGINNQASQPLLHS